MEQPGATLGETLTVHGDVTRHEIDELVHRWRNLDRRLGSFDVGTVRTDLFVKDRDTSSQHVTLEVSIQRWPALIATSAHPDLERGLNEVRDEMIRLINDARDRHHPRNRRRRGG